MLNEQEKFWSGSFGNSYINRNKFKDTKEFNQFYFKRYGITRDKINKIFFSNISYEKPVLEIGCNIGNQLNALSRIGFKNLYGIDINKKSLKIAKLKNNFNFIEASGFDIPFRNSFFNLVFTNNVLIHIHPNKLKKIMKEIGRVSNNYIAGFEYFDNKITKVNYRNYKNKLWKGDYTKIYMKNLNNLKIIKEKIYQNLDDTNNFDKFYLLKKK